MSEWLMIEKLSLMTSNCMEQTQYGIGDTYVRNSILVNMT